MFRIIQILVTVTLLIFVAWWVGLFSVEGRALFLEMLASANLYYLLLSVMVGVLVNLSSSLKWYMLARARGMLVGYWRTFSYYLIGQFYNLFLPTSVGGDVVRSYELGKYTGRHADSLASVFVERYTGLVVLLLVAGLAVLSQLAVFSVTFVFLSLGFFAVLLSLIAWMIVDPRLYHAIRLFLLKKIPMTEPLFDKLDKLLASVQVYGQHKSALAWAFINSLVFYFLAVVNVYITAKVFQMDVSFTHMLVATPIIMLIMNIPFSLGNLGLMEYGYSAVFQLMGYSPALGLSVALLMRAKSLFDGALGGVLHPIFVTGGLVKK